MKHINLILLILLCSATIQSEEYPPPKHFDAQVPIDRTSFTCEIHYESYYSEVTYINNEFLSQLGEGMRHHKATYRNDSPRSYFSECERHEQIFEDAEANGGMVDADVEVTWYKSRTIVGCEGGSWGGCHTPIYAWVPATEVILTFKNGLQLTSRGCGATLGCWD